MANARNPPAPAGPPEVLGDADNLMSRHRTAAAVRPADPRQRTLPSIPTLTDVVAGPVQGAGRAPAPKPRKPTAQNDQLRRLEDYVLARIKERLDGEIDALVEKRLMPGAADAMAQIIGEATDLLRASLRDLVRETIQEALARSRHGEPEAAATGKATDADDRTP
jgi:hypothetical protein